jgi:hypothetical protein
MASRNYGSKTIEISVDRYSQLVACESTLGNVKKIVDGRYSMNTSELITSLNCILKAPEPNEKSNEQP